MRKIMMFIGCLGLGIFQYGLMAQTRYVVDPEMSVLEWKGEKVLGEHTGTIKLKSGEMMIDNNLLKSGKFVIDMTSIANQDIKDPEMNTRLVNHLKSDDFFGVQKFPEAILVIKNNPDFSTGSAEVNGDLTIKGITHPVSFRATRSTIGDTQKYFAKIIVDRAKYDVKYGSGSFFDNLGDKTIYDEFELRVNITANK